MNQILDYGDGSNENVGKSKKSNFDGGRNNYNNGMNNGKTPISDKIIKVFALLMIILAIALIASGVMSLLKNKKDETTKKETATKAPEVTADIVAELNEISGKVKITINSSIPITKWMYSWDEEHDNVNAGQKQTSIEEEILTQSGEHTLHIQVTDEENNKTTKDFTFDSAIGVDAEKPEIKLSVTEDKKLLVRATDDTSISYVTYTWNEEETVTMTPEEETKEYEFELDIPVGKNTIVVFAVDGSEEGNATTASKVLEGVEKPIIKPEWLDREGHNLQITVSHGRGVKSISYKLNGQLYTWEDEPQTELSFTIESVEGHNELELTVTSVEDTKEELNINWDYGETEINPSDSDEDSTVQNSGEDSEDTGSDETTENN